MKKILIVQTAFLGDVVLATALVEKLHKFYPEARLGFLLRKGNEGLLKDHPLLHQVMVWNKKEGKYKSLLRLLSQIRAEKYDLVVNVQRFGSTGFLTAFSGAKETVGFEKNPFSRLFTRRYVHDVRSGTHEVERNNMLIQSVTNAIADKPKLYPSQVDFAHVQHRKQEPYICMAPTSVWFTKQFPKKQWVTLINSLDPKYKVYLLGSPADKQHCDEIIAQSINQRVENLCGQLSLLQSAALMRDAVLNYVNDSGPMHLASALNAPTCAIYCSTVPRFGFGPLADFAQVVERTEPLHCRPCGLHGHKACPEGHFKCAHEIRNEQLLEVLKVRELES
ncbi:glycosyltransferase family 9 protein [Pontibacter oryzae]|uniref:Glycosyltransferase family 9 protein n=1 Tax=Pontibacter oryzae TaxID=2304593 RepID=A0A399S2J6_9BACT|nr:glycosyltransferase family 9 protein [Pontibacter oryzae]RIJ36924.1 glycosyltransferase family 9 protein [Pontibacter oryzae]